MQTVDRIGDTPTGKTFTVRITESAGEIHDLRYRFIWSAWLDGELLGEGHAFNPDEALALAHDLLSPEDVEHLVIDYRLRERPSTYHWASVRPGCAGSPSVGPHLPGGG